jgi:hypothetical protein
MKKLLDSFVDKQAELISLLEKHNISCEKLYRPSHPPSDKLIFSIVRDCVVEVDFIKNKVVGLYYKINIKWVDTIDTIPTANEIYDWLCYNCYDILSEEQKTYVKTTRPHLFK